MGQESAGDIVYKETFYVAVSVSEMVAIVPGTGLEKCHGNGKGKGAKKRKQL